jgi:hypothetical protein
MNRFLYTVLLKLNLILYHLSILDSCEIYGFMLLKYSVSVGCIY